MHVKKKTQHVKILRIMPVNFFFVPVKKNQKSPFIPLKNDNFGVKKARKSAREKLMMHVKKSKKRSKNGFHAHFRFHVQKNTHWKQALHSW